MAFGSVTQSEFLTVDGDYEFFKDDAGNDAIAIQLTPGERCTFRFHMDAVGTTDDLEIEVLQGHRISNGNTLDGATAADDLELDTAADGFSNDDDMNGTFIVMTSGDERGEGKMIDDSVASDDGVNLENALSGTPSAGESYALYNLEATAWAYIDSAAADDDNPHRAGVTVGAEDGEWVLVRARANGATDAHRVRMSYQVDGVDL
jgi:hypothetical protein